MSHYTAHETHVLSTHVDTGGDVPYQPVVLLAHQTAGEKGNTHGTVD